MKQDILTRINRARQRVHGMTPNQIDQLRAHELVRRVMLIDLLHDELIEVKRIITASQDKRELNSFEKLVFSNNKHIIEHIFELEYTAGSTVLHDVKEIISDFFDKTTKDKRELSKMIYLLYLVNIDFQNAIFPVEQRTENAIISLIKYLSKRYSQLHGKDFNLNDSMLEKLNNRLNKEFDKLVQVHE